MREIHSTFTLRYILASNSTPNDMYTLEQADGHNACTSDSRAHILMQVPVYKHFLKTFRRTHAHTGRRIHPVGPAHRKFCERQSVSRAFLRACVREHE